MGLGLGEARDYSTTVGSPPNQNLLGSLYKFQTGWQLRMLSYHSYGCIVRRHGFPDYDNLR